MWSENILHVDMDSFFVEVERLRDPSLVGRPVAVGGTGARGVIASASYEARTYGVRSAQPTESARRMCKHLVVLPSSHGRYGEVSTEVFAIFRRFTPMVEGLSLDEAFLDVSGLRNHYRSPVAVGESVRKVIKSELGMPASVGIASTKFVAKLASEAAKPDGLKHVPVEDQLGFLHGLPAESLWGVGPATLAGLGKLGIETVGEIAEIPKAALTKAIGSSAGAHLHDLANGIDPRSVVPDNEAQSVSVEQTYDQDLVGAEVIEAALLSHAHRLSGRLRRSGLAARTVSLKLRYGDFTTSIRSHTFGHPLDGARELYGAGRTMLQHFDLDRPVRLLGLGGGSLESASRPRQLDLTISDSWEKIEEAVAEVRSRYGDDAISPARLIDGEKQLDEEPW
ncbi:MAG: DNA polymerase IV [Acidimicrobiia bacterium]